MGQNVSFNGPCPTDSCRWVDPETSHGKSAIWLQFDSGIYVKRICCKQCWKEIEFDIDYFL